MTDEILFFSYGLLNDKRKQDPLWRWRQ